MGANNRQLSCSGVLGFFKDQTKVGLAAALLCGVCAGTAYSQNENQSLRIYNCVDARGRTLSADRPIQACQDREQRILGGASVYQKGVLEPSYTEDERAALLAQEQARSEKNRLENEARQRRRLLQLRYPDRSSYARDRAAATEQVEALIASANFSLLKLHDVAASYQQELEFYQRDIKAAPPSLLARIEGNQRDIAEQQKFTEQQVQEKTRIEARYDADLPLLEAIWAAKPVD